MSGAEGTSVPQTQLRMPPFQGPQVFRAPPERHFPLFSAASRPSPTFDHRIFSDLRGKPSVGPDKDKIIAANIAAARQTFGDLKQRIGAHDYEIIGSESARKQEVKEEICTDILPPASGTSGKRQRKSKSSKQRRLQQQDPQLVDGSPSSALGLSNPNNCRYDSSLGLLTKKFINLLQQAEDGTLDLNRAAETLDVQKRRIYDITNVLEGVGLIEKKLKNRIRWKGVDMSKPRELDDQVAALRSAVETLQTEESRLDGMISDMQENLRLLSDDENNRKWLYLTKEDITNLPCFEDATLVAIKAPHGTSVEVPDPYEGVEFPHRRYQILLRSAMGPIDCYLLSCSQDERSEASNHGQQPEDMDLSEENTFLDKDDRCFQCPGRDGGGPSEKGQCRAIPSDPAQSITSQECAGGLVKIVPSDVDMDADYWLLSDIGLSVTDTWRIEWKIECVMSRPRELYIKLGFVHSGTSMATSAGTLGECKVHKGRAGKSPGKVCDTC